MSKRLTITDFHGILVDFLLILTKLLKPLPIGSTYLANTNVIIME